MAKIIVTSKKYGEKIIIVDDEDFDRLNSWKWWVAKRCNTFYAGRSVWVPERKVVYMHREILGITDSKIEIDHKDRNGLNNQRDNLRESTKRQNGCNKKSRQNSSSKYLGVSLWRGRWRATIKNNKKQVWLGFHPTEENAALAYNSAAIKIHGEFANLNVIQLPIS